MEAAGFKAYVQRSVNELFNAFNRVNLGQPITLADSPAAGRSTGLGPLAQMGKWQPAVRQNF